MERDNIYPEAVRILEDDGWHREPSIGEGGFLRRGRENETIGVIYYYELRDKWLAPGPNEALPTEHERKIGLGWLRKEILIRTGRAK
jgi:hypothetical protein